MLPRPLYELLPYLYLAIGFSTSLILDSSMVFIAATLLIATGIAILFMRFNYRRNIRQMLIATRSKSEMATGYMVEAYIKTAKSASSSGRRSGKDRRQRQAVTFPLWDDLGNVVTGERRVGDRRLNVQASDVF